MARSVADDAAQAARASRCSAETDRVAEQTGAANTVLLDDGARARLQHRCRRARRAPSRAPASRARGSCTSSAAEPPRPRPWSRRPSSAPSRSTSYARSLERSVWLEPLAHELGLMIRIRPLGQADRSLDVPTLVISTLPGGAATDALFTDSTRRRAAAARRRLRPVAERARPRRGTPSAAASSPGSRCSRTRRCSRCASSSPATRAAARRRGRGARRDARRRRHRRDRRRSPDARRRRAAVHAVRHTDGGPCRYGRIESCFVG